MAAVAGEPQSLLDLGSPVLAAGSFLLVTIVGAATRGLRPALLDRAVAAALGRPGRTPIYGVIAALLGWLGATYTVGRAARFGGDTVGRVVAAAAAGVMLTIAGFGFAVVGVSVTTAAGDDRPGIGVGVGAAISALVPLSLPARPALLVWVVLAAAGIGGPVRRWFRASQSVEGDPIDDE